MPSIAVAGSAVREAASLLSRGGLIPKPPTSQHLALIAEFSPAGAVDSSDCASSTATHSPYRHLAHNPGTRAG